MKICSKCKEPKLPDEFPRDKKAQGGRRSMCKQCKIKQNEAREAAGQIYCARGVGGYIDKGKCLPGCNEVCSTCPDRQEGNLMAINNTTTEEDREQIYNGGSGKGRAGGFATKSVGSSYQGE